MSTDNLLLKGNLMTTWDKISLEMIVTKLYIVDVPDIYMFVLIPNGAYWIILSVPNLDCPKSQKETKFTHKKFKRKKVMERHEESNLRVAKILNHQPGVLGCSIRPRIPGRQGKQRTSLLINPDIFNFFENNWTIFGVNKLIFLSSNVLNEIFNL